MAKFDPDTAYDFFRFLRDQGVLEMVVSKDEGSILEATPEFILLPKVHIGDIAGIKIIEDRCNYT